MAMQSTPRPREKLKQHGVESLTDRELVQLLVASGSGKYRVGRIATKVLAIIKSQNAELSYEQLEAIPGLGLARISQLLSMFELASRYPLRQKSVRLESVNDIITHITDGTSSDRHLVITTDGARYLINQRSYRMNIDHDTSVLLRKAVHDVVADGASGVIIVLRSRLRTITPIMTGLMAARDLRYIAKFLGFRVDNVIVDQNGQYQPVVTIEEGTS